MASKPIDVTESANNIAKRLAEQGIIPPAPNLDYIQRKALSQKDQEVFGKTPTGLPEDWDYKTATLGPDNQEMLEGQVGWTFAGERFFGGSSAIENWWNGVISRVRAPIEMEYDDKDKEIVKFDDAPDLKKVTTAFGRAIGEVFSGGLALLQEVDEEIEQIRGGLRGAAESQGFVDDPLTQGLHTLDLGGFNFVRDIIQSFNIVGIANEALQATRAAVTDPTKAAEGFGAGYEAGRILYTTLNEPAIKAEYMRRMNAGENKWLLAEELQNPVREMWGELGSGLLTGKIAASILKAFRTVGMVDDAARMVAKGADDAIDAALTARKATSTADAGASMSRLANAVSDYSKKLQNGLARSDSALIRRKGLKFFSPLTPESAKVNAAHKAFAIVGNLVSGSAGNPSKLEDIAGALRGFGKLHGTQDEIIEGLSLIEKAGVPANVALSEAGMETGLILKKVLGDNPAGYLDELQSATTTGEMLEKFGPRLDEALDAIYPTSKTLTGVVKTADAITGSKFYSGARRLMGSVYMGYNPGFAVRAIATDTLHVFADAGWRGAVEAATPVGKGITRSEAWISKAFGFVPEAAKEGLTPAGALSKGETIKGFASKWASNFQSKASVISFKHFAQRAFENMYNKIGELSFPALKRAGMTDDALRLMRRSFDDLGDADAVAKYMKTILKKGYVDGKELLWLDDTRYGLLKDFDLLDDYKAALKASDTAEDALSAHNRIFDSLEAAAKEAGKVPTGLAQADDVIQVAPTLEKAVESGLVAPNTNVLSNVQKTINLEVEHLFDDMFVEARRVGSRIGANDIDALLPSNIRQFSDGSFLRQRVQDFNQRVSAPMFAIYDELKTVGNNADVSKYWKLFGMQGVPPATLNKDQMIRMFWEDVYFPASRQYFKSVREEFVKGAEQVVKTLTKADPRFVQPDNLTKIDKALKEARMWDSAAVTQDGIMVANNNIDDIRRLAIRNGIPTATKGGVPTKQLLNLVNKNLPEGVEKFTDEALIPYEVAEQAIKQSLGEKFVPLSERLGIMDKPVLGDLLPRMSRYSDAAPTPSRMLYEQIDGIRNLRATSEDLLKKNWDTQVATTGNSQLDEAIDAWAKEAKPKFFEAKTVAERVGTAGRDFTVLPYSTGRTNIDTMLGVIYPYHFWHSRTYLNWIKRAATNPGLIAAYGKYKDMMAEIHAGAPDWWKYNVRSDELLGTHSDNPLMFNLEASLNPLNGLIGVDFNDPNKRVDWWTRTLDDVGKWGPAPWTFFSLATAMSLHARGEEEAASLWAGRLIPQTKVLQAGLSVAGVGPGDLSVLGIDPFEADPAISLFSGGIDPYVKRSGIPRALTAMVQDGTITEDQMIDAAESQSGEIWDMAYERAVNERAPGQLTSFFLGQGFRARSLGDLQVDEFYADYFRLMKLRDTTSPQEFRNGLDQLRQEYPFMEALLISKKAGDDKDTALAWNAINRLPPSSSSLLKTIGIDQSIVDKFFDTMGDWSTWQSSEKDRFMAGMTDLRALLATPADATRQEWTQVKAMSNAIYTAMEQIFGADIRDQIDQFFANKEDDPDYQASPVVTQALDYRNKAVANNPLLATYYGGVDAIAKYYESLMYADIREQMGDDIWQKFNSDGATRAEQRKYAKIRDSWNKRIDAAILNLGNYLPEGKPAEIRPDAGELSSLQQDFVEELDPQIDLNQVVQQLGQEVSSLLLDLVEFGQPIPNKAREKVEGIAEEYGISYYELLRMFEEAMSQ